MFCITACGAGQCAIEAYLNGSQQGVLTFCLLEALKQFRQCTFLEWMTAANKEATRLRGEVLPALDQFFEIAYGRHVGLHESRLLDHFLFQNLFWYGFKLLVPFLFFLVLGSV